MNFKASVSFAFGCLMSTMGSTFAQTALPSGISKEELFGSVLRKSKWEILTIPVCWENPSSGDAKYRSITRSAVEETWQRYSKLKFTGWEKCAAVTKGMRIKIADEGPHTTALGRYLANKPNGMVLNFDFRNWSQPCQQKKEFCVYAIAAHEFGHALGFAHEQNRADAPAECRKESQGTVGDYSVTKYDEFSIMNYCNPTWNGDGKLSALDIEALHTFYGE